MPGPEFSLVLSAPSSSYARGSLLYRHGTLEGYQAWKTSCQGGLVAIFLSGPKFVSILVNILEKY